MSFRLSRYVQRIGAACMLAATMLGSGAGCTVDAWYHGTVPWPFWMPVPVPQVIGDKIQEKKEKQYDEVPIMPPVRDYAPVFCLDPPSEYDVIRAMIKPNGCGHIPFFYEQQYNDIQIVVEKIVDHIDECRFYPLVGPAQLHHCHFKVTVYFERRRFSGYPFAWWVTEPDCDVIFIDKDHLHICTSPEMEAIPESYRDTYGSY